jgi:hypothetical protein
MARAATPTSADADTSDGSAAKALCDCCAHLVARDAGQLAALFSPHATVDIAPLGLHVRASEVAPALAKVVGYLTGCEIVLDIAGDSRTAVGTGRLSAQSVGGPVDCAFTVVVEVDGDGKIAHLSESLVASARLGLE